MLECREGVEGGVTTRGVEHGFEVYRVRVRRQASSGQGICRARVWVRVIIGC